MHINKTTNFINFSVIFSKYLLQIVGIAPYLSQHWAFVMQIRAVSHICLLCMNSLFGFVFYFQLLLFIESW